VQENGEALDCKETPLVPAKNGKLIVELNSHFAAHFVVKVFLFVLTLLFLVWDNSCPKTCSSPVQGFVLV
jgi:hypothetical protein